MSPIRAALPFFVLVGVAGLAVAQPNLIANDRFDADLSGWQDVGPAETWDGAVDANGDAGSGSLRISHSGVASTGFYVEQCVPVMPGGTYTYGATARADAPVATGRADVDLVFWASLDCEDGVAGGADPVGSSAVGVWTPLETSAVAPAGAAAATLSLGAFKQSGFGGDLWIVHYDDAFVFAPEPGAAALGSTAIAVLGLWSRRRR